MQATSITLVPTPAVAPLVWLAAAFAGGIGGTAARPDPLVPVDPGVWFAVAAVALLCMAVGRLAPARRARMSMIGLAALACAVGGLRASSAARDWGAATMRVPGGSSGCLVRLRGTLETAPRMVWPRGSLAAFEHRDARSVAVVRAESWMDGTSSSARAGDAGGVRVRLVVDARAPPVRAGDRVDVLAMINAPAAPAEIGAFDARRRDRREGIVATLRAASWKQIAIATGRSVPSALDRYQSAARWRIEQCLREGLPDAQDEPGRRRDALLRAVFLGQSDPWATDLHDVFRRVGLAHVLAISGLHLGIVVGLLLLALRWRGAARPWHAWVLVAAVLGLLCVVESRPSVLRAGIMALVAAVGMGVRRRWRLDGGIALAVVVLLFEDPWRVESAGFQLSVLVVLALVLGAPRVQARWFPEIPIARRLAAQDRGPARIRRRRVLALRAAFTRTLTAAVVASVVAAPLSLVHFGTVPTLSAPLALLAVPLLAIVLGCGLVKIGVTAVLPAAGAVLAVPMVIAADAMILLARSIDAWPGAQWTAPPPPAAWGVAALALVFAWITGVAARHKRVTAGLLLALVAVVLAPHGARRGAPALRLETLAVGDGTCHVVRSGMHAVLIDAGSRSLGGVGERLIVPALGRRGIRRLDAVFVSHPDFDHFGAVLDVVAAVVVGEVVVTEALVRAAARSPAGPERALLAGLHRARVPVRTLTAGAVRTLGAARLRWWHPPPRTRYASDNDGGMALTIDVAGRRLLLTADLEAEGLAALDRALGPGRVDVLEIPHHGADERAAYDFAKRRDPLVAVTSRGRRPRGQWRSEVPAPHHFVTALHGTVRIEVGWDGSLSAEGCRTAPRGGRVEMGSIGEDLHRAHRAHLESR